MVDRLRSSEQRQPVAVVHVNRLWQRPQLVAGMAEADLWMRAAWQLSDQAARPIEELAERCLVLVGEPGTGKSTVVQRYAESIQQGGTEDVLFADLGSFGSEQRLFEEVLRSDQVQEWVGGNRVLHLFLDGLDEGLRLVPSLAKGLDSVLRSWPVERLRLVTTCRSADWPTSLEDRLRKLIGAVGLYTILPLDEHQVALIAGRNGVDAQEFALAVSAAGAWDLARIPLTLRLLIKIHRAEGALPSDQAELFARGLRELCREHDDLRRPPPSPTPDERLLVAERLAAMTVFGGLTGFLRDSHERTGQDPGLASPADCAGGDELSGAYRVFVDPAVVKEALGTGLFAARGSGVLGWSHQRFAEFLAARFLQRRQVEDGQLRNLVLSGDGRAIPPQTRAVAVWLATLGAPIADAIIAADPEAFVSSGVVLPEDRMRAAVTGALLDAAAAERLRDPFGRFYEGLAHPDMADQLEPLLGDVGSDLPERHVAVEIAADCRASALLPALLAVALSTREPYHLRSSAALGVAQSGDPSLVPQLLPLARAAGDDPYDELRGAALRGLWPNHLEVDALLECLRRPARNNFVGSYRMFLGEFLDDLRDEDLPTVLRWAAAQAEDHGANRRALGYAIVRVIEKLARRALQRIDDDETVSALVELAWGLRRSGERLLPDDVVLDPHARRGLIQAALDHLGRNPDEVYDVPQLFRGHALLHADDLRWLYARHAEAEIPERRTAVARLMRWGFDPANPQHRQLAFEVAALREHEEHAAALYDELFASWIEPVELESDTATKLRENYRLVHGDPQAHDDDRAMTVEEVRERVLESLQAAEQGDMDAYWRCDRWMTVEPGDFPRFEDLSDDLSERPVWTHLDEDERQRVVLAARQYLRGDPEPEKWLGTNTLYPPAMAGYRAAVLLYTRAPSLLHGLADEIWGRWAPVIYDSPVTASEGKADVKRALLQRAYDVAPDAVIEAVEADLGKTQREGQGLFASDFLDAIWERRLGDHIAAWVEREAPEGRLADDLIELLVRNGHPRGIELALADLNGRDRMADSTAAARAVRILLGHSAAAHWPAVRQAIEQDAAFGEQVMAQLSGQAWDGLLSLEAQELAWLYEWLVAVFPPSADPVHDSEVAHFVTPREEVGRRRDRLPMALAQRSTEEALAALRALVERSDRALLRHHLREAEEAALERSWTPVQPQELLQLLERADARVVRTGEDLLAVVEESLLRYQDRLQSGHAAAYLWDENADRGRPKSELRLSQHLADHLKDDLRVVVNREVEVQPPPTGKGLGPRTDLKIDALSPIGEPLPVVVEVKGLWNDEVVEGIESQLVGKYLDPSATRHGLYVAFWFDPRAWDPKDLRRRAAARWTRDRLEEMLTERAAVVTTDGRTVRAHVIDATIPGTV